MDLALKSIGEKEGIADLYRSDPSSRLRLLRGMAGRVNLAHDGIIPCDSEFGVGQAMCLVCLKFPGASEENEPLVAAGMLTRVSREKHPLPMASEDSGVVFCAKTLVSLALFLPAMIFRRNRRGAPDPGFYRRTAEGILGRGTAAHRALSAHHRAWEDFLHEQFCPEGAGT